MNFNEKDVIERIRQLRVRHSGLRGKSSFAKALGLSASTYNYYEDDRMPPISVLLKISEITGADLNWIVKGEQKSNLSNFSKRDMEILKRLSVLTEKNPHSADAVLSLIDLLEEANDIRSESKFVGENVNDMIPILGRTAAGIAGFWSESIISEPEKAALELSSIVERHVGSEIEKAHEYTARGERSCNNIADLPVDLNANLIQMNSGSSSEITDFIQCHDIKKLYPDSFALWIDGDSMSPRIEDGQIVILSPSVQAQQGQVSVVKIQGQIGVTCKILRVFQGMVHLIPINERYETIIVPQEQILWSLAVLCKIKTGL